MDHPLPENPESNPPRPDWLVGAEEGASSERERPAPAEEPTPIRLVRPMPEHPDFSDLERTANPGRAVPDQSLSLSSRNAPPEPKKKAWTAAASSVPRLSLVQGGSPMPSATPASARFESEPDADVDADTAPVDGFLDDPASAEAPPPANRSTNASYSVVLREPWWVIALDAVRTDRRIQLGLLVVAAIAIGFVLLQPKEDARQSLRTIRTHPERFDGQTVTVDGRVGEVFPVGGGYAFFLHQGRDTLVVFTRSRRPQTREKVVVKGSISTGFLDGRPRQALFEAL